MKNLATLSLVGVALLARQANADTFNFSFNGSGVSGQIALTYTPGSATTNGAVADKITGITGTFSDGNVGLHGKPDIENATITGLVGINPVNPLPAAVLAPDFSYFPIANGVEGGSEPSPALSYDNTFYPGGSPIVCTDYPASGGFLDIYGIMFTLSTGQSVDFWSNGTFSPNAPVTYGAAVADGTFTYDYQGNIAVPEPTALGVMTFALAGFATRRRRAR